VNQLPHAKKEVVQGGKCEKRDKGEAELPEKNADSTEVGKAHDLKGRQTGHCTWGIREMSVGKDPQPPNPPTPPSSQDPGESRHKERGMSERIIGGSLKQ